MGKVKGSSPFGSTMKLKVLMIALFSVVLSACNTKPIVTPRPQAQALKCEYQNGTQTTFGYIQNDKVRLNGTSNIAFIEALIDKNTFYLWNLSDKTGISLDLNKVTTAKMGQIPVKSAADVISVLQSNPQNCVSVSDDIPSFSLPIDIKFTESSDLFKK